MTFFFIPVRYMKTTIIIITEMKMKMAKVLMDFLDSNPLLSQSEKPTKASR